MTMLQLIECMQFQCTAVFTALSRITILSTGLLFCPIRFAVLVWFKPTPSKLVTFWYVAMLTRIFLFSLTTFVPSESMLGMIPSMLHVAVVIVVHVAAVLKLCYV